MLLIIDRQKWLRGRRPENSGLLVSNTVKDMCCLGFYCKALGAADEQLLNRSMPNEIVNQGFILPSEADWLVTKVDEHVKNSDDCSSLSRINDDDEILDEDREDILAKKFATHGVIVQFIN